MPARSVPFILTVLMLGSFVNKGVVPLLIKDVTRGDTKFGLLEYTTLPSPLSSDNDPANANDEMDPAEVPYYVPVAGSVTVEPAAEFKVIAPPVVAKFALNVIVFPVLATPVPPNSPATGPVKAAEPSKELP